jgi:hypothetical protein
MNILQQPKRVIIESPYRATPHYTEEQHRLYLLHCIEDSVKMGEAPFASHLLLPEILDDDDAYERAVGIRCGFAWGQHAEMIAVYQDFGLSAGMREAINYYQSIGKPIEWRKLPDKVVASIKQFGEFTNEEPPHESSTVGIDSPAVSFADR